jgi:hypothetical protein
MCKRDGLAYPHVLRASERIVRKSSADRSQGRGCAQGRPAESLGARLDALVWSPRCQALIFDNGIFLPLLVRPRRRVSAEPDTGRPGSRQFQFGDAPLHQYHRASGRSKTAIAASKDRSEIIEREGLNTNQNTVGTKVARVSSWMVRAHHSPIHLMPTSSYCSLELKPRTFLGSLSRGDPNANGAHAEAAQIDRRDRSDCINRPHGSLEHSQLCP